MPEPKYTAAVDEDGSWSVIDGQSEIPAVVDGVPQVGLSQDQAEDIAGLLNAMTNDGDG